MSSLFIRPAYWQTVTPHPAEVARRKVGLSFVSPFNPYLRRYSRATEVNNPNAHSPLLNLWGVDMPDNNPDAYVQQDSRTRWAL